MIGIIILAVCVLIVTPMIIANRRLARVRAQLRVRNFQWYRSTYPDSFRNGRVLCYDCGCDRVHSGIYRQGYSLREHYCSQCRTPLYYSGE